MTNVRKSELVAFAPGWKKGDEWRFAYTFVSEFKTKHSLNAGFTGHSHGAICMDFNVRSVGRTGNATLEFVYRLGELHEFITDGKKTAVPYAGADGMSPLQKMYAYLPGLSFTATFDRFGKIVKTTGFRDNLRALMSAVSVTQDISRERKLTASDLDQFTKMFADSFNAENMKEILEYAFRIHPKKRVRVGTQWSIRSWVNLKPESRPTVTTIRLHSATRNRINLRFDVQANSTTGTYGEVYDGSGSGSIKIDRTTGIPTKLVRRTRIVMTNDFGDSTVRHATKRHQTIEIFR